MDLVSFLAGTLKLAWNVLVFPFEALLWLQYGSRHALNATADVVKLGRVATEGLFCPRDHPVPTVGTYECTACGFVYQGDVWVCPNPECPAPVATYVHCPTCSLSVRNPYRFGGR
jgi:rubredoxin